MKKIFFSIYSVLFLGIISLSAWADMNLTNVTPIKFCFVGPNTSYQTIQSAVDSTECNTIWIAEGTYNERVFIEKDLSIIGTNRDSVILDGTGVDSSGGGLIGIQEGYTVSIKNITIQNGNTTYYGGAIFNSGTAKLSNCVLKDNMAGEDGGAIVNTGNLTVNDCDIHDNYTRSHGGGISNHDTLIVKNSNIRNNYSNINGGGIGNYGSLLIRKTSITANESGNHGGGISNTFSSRVPEYVGIVNIKNTTVAFNTSDNEGGGIYTLIGGSIDINNSTIYGNTGVGIHNEDNENTIEVSNTIIANNDGGDCSGTIQSQNNNLDSDGSCALTASDDLSNQDPDLKEINTSDIITFTPYEGSPIVDAGNNATCTSHDQIGTDRPYDGDSDGSAICDIGSIEATYLETR